MDMQPLTELARTVVAQVAPSELPLFKAMIKAHADGPGRVRSGPGRDEVLGFGLTEFAPLLTPVVLATVHQVADYLAEDLEKAMAHSTAEAVAKRVAKLFRREPDTPPLTQAQLSRIRTIAAEVVRIAAVPEAQASLLVEALVAHLAAPPAAS